jgi:hypothetical protein
MLISCTLSNFGVRSRVFRLQIWGLTTFHIPTANSMPRVNGPFMDQEEADAMVDVADAGRLP